MENQTPNPVEVISNVGYLQGIPMLHRERIVDGIDPRLDADAASSSWSNDVLVPGASRRAMRAIRGAVDELAESLRGGGVAADLVGRRSVKPRIAAR